MQFLYMARRDKYTIEVVSTFRESQTKGYKRNLQIQNLTINDQQKFKLDQIYTSNRFDWELIVEDAPDYASLRKSLFMRGYKHVPSSHKELLPHPKQEFLKNFS
jgi:hypothetical protein